MAPLLLLHYVLVTCPLTGMSIKLGQPLTCDYVDDTSSKQQVLPLMFVRWVKATDSSAPPGVSHPSVTICMHHCSCLYKPRRQLVLEIPGDQQFVPDGLLCLFHKQLCHIESLQAAFNHVCFLGLFEWHHQIFPSLELGTRKWFVN